MTFAPLPLYHSQEVPQMYGSVGQVENASVGAVPLASDSGVTDGTDHIVIERKRADSHIVGGPLELDSSFVRMVDEEGTLRHMIYAAVTGAGGESKEEIVPKDLILLMDISKSMIAIMDKVKEAISFLVQEYCTEQFRVGLVVFDDEASIAYNLAPMTPDKKQRLLEAIDTALVPRGRTSIGLGLHRAFQVGHTVRQNEERATEKRE